MKMFGNFGEVCVCVPPLTKGKQIVAFVLELECVQKKAL